MDLETFAKDMLYHIKNIELLVGFLLAIEVFKLFTRRY